jgi:hypothetical protein
MGRARCAQRIARIPDHVVDVVTVALGGDEVVYDGLAAVGAGWHSAQVVTTPATSGLRVVRSIWLVQRTSLA